MNNQALSKEEKTVIAYRRLTAVERSRAVRSLLERGVFAVNDRLEIYEPNGLAPTAQTLSEEDRSERD